MYWKQNSIFFNSADKQRLIIEDIYLQHTNHDGSEDFYDMLPQNRQLPLNEKEEVKGLINMKASASSIKNKILKETGIIMTAKDYQNTKQRMKPTDDYDTLPPVIAPLRQRYNATVDVHYIKKETKEGTGKFFSSLFFQTEDMKKIFEAWPEVVFIDGTYNLLKNRLITIVLYIVDYNGLSQIIGMAWVVNEEGNNFNGTDEAVQSKKCGNL